MKISVVTPTFEAAATVLTCCKSVRWQNREMGSGKRFELEHIVVDGKSNDGTIEIVETFETVNRCVSEPDHGIYDAMNKGVRMADGDVVAILNADDFYVTNDVLVKVADVLDSTGADSCYGNVVYVGAEDPTRPKRVWRAGDFLRGRFRHGWMPPHPAFFVRRSCYERYGVFRLDVGTAADYEMMVRLLVQKKVSSVWIPDLWVAVRAGGASNGSIRARLRANRMDRMAWSVNGLLPWPWMRAMKPLRKLPQYARPRQLEVGEALERCWHTLRTVS